MPHTAPSQSNMGKWGRRQKVPVKEVKEVDSVTIDVNELPEELQKVYMADPKKFLGLLATFNKEKIQGKKRDRATMEAVKRLKELHPADWLKIRNEEFKNQGLTVKVA